MESKIHDYEQCDWFHGRISKEDAFRNLSGMYQKHRSTNGIFLVREKSENYFILCLLHEKQERKFEIVKEKNTNMFKIGDAVEQFDSLIKLIEFLQNSDTSLSGLPCCPTLACTKHVESESSDIKTSLRKASLYLFTSKLSGRKVNRFIRSKNFTILNLSICYLMKAFFNYSKNLKKKIPKV